MKNLKTLCTTSALALALSVSVVSEAKDLIVLVDVSQSNPMLTDKNFNRRAAEYVFAATKALNKGDTVSVQTFGSLTDTQNLNIKSQTVSRHNSKKVANSVGRYVMSLPEQIAGQGSTNLLSWFNRNAFDCSQEAHHILVITDGLEASEYVNPQRLLDGKQALPAPTEFVNLAGCDVTFYGVGSGMHDRSALHLRKVWGEYFKQAKVRFKDVPL